MMSSISLWPKQQEAFEFARGREAVALLCEQRTGKTYISLKLLESYCDGNLAAVLVVLLNNKSSTWVEGIKSHLPVVSLHTDPLAFRSQKSGDRILLMHYEQFTTSIKLLVKMKGINLLLFDEAQRLSSRGSKGSRAASRMSWVPRRLILTGTPIEKKPTDMFGQFRFLDPRVFGTNYSDFESEYLEWKKLPETHLRPGTHEWQRRVLQERILKSKATFNPKKVDQFLSRIDPYCFRLTAEDVGVLRSDVSKVVVPMSRSQARCYREIDRSSVTVTPKGRTVIVDLPVVAVVRKRQIASGYVRGENSNGDPWLERFSCPKLDKLLDMVESLPKPIVVFTAFEPDTDRVSQALRDEGYEVGVLEGKTKKEDRPGLIKSFQDANLDALVCQIRAGGVGIDLWKANNSVVFSMGHSYRDWSQASARLNVGHKNKASRVWVLCSKDTVDEELYDLVLMKHLTGKSVLDRLRNSHRPRKG